VCRAVQDRGEDTVITRQQIRAVLADGGRLIDPAGQPLGRMADVVLDAGTFQPTWVTVDCPPCTGVEVVVPLARARLLDACVQVPYTAAAICGAPRSGVSEGRLDRRREEELRRYYAVLDDAAPVAWPESLPADHLPDWTVSATPAPVWPGMPTVRAVNGHRRTNGVPATSHPGDAGILPAVVGLDVRTGDRGPAAYPPTPSGPWPPVATSSAGPPWWQRRQWRWPSRPGSVRAMRVELRPILDLTGLPDDDVDDLVLAAGEAATNAVEHARLPTLPFFDVSTEVGEHRARIMIQDHGRWRTPSAGGDRGRGLAMIGVLTDATLTVASQGTTVVLCNRPGATR
jgi:anti-sigma regulatory factor (Ser/Thr protein kinase)